MAKLLTLESHLISMLSLQILEVIVRGVEPRLFSFYGGVCGVASQLFRASLSSPQVRIDKRWGHNDRYMQYYGSEVEGDDAAVYERSKQFVFTNTSDSPFLIKTEESRNHTKLFFITEDKGC